MSQLTHQEPSVAFATYRYVPTVAGRSRLPAVRVYPRANERVRSKKVERRARGNEKGKQSEEESKRDKKSDEGSAYRSFRAFPRRSFTLLQKPDSPVSH